MRLININKTYHNQNNEVTVFKDLSYDFPDYGLTMILGESGSGKTTLFNVMSNRDQDYTGVVERTGHIEYLNQKVELFETLSIWDNLKLVSQDETEITRWLERFSILEISKHLIKHLSNGEKRRVQMIRSFLVHPDLLLCDEPTASLDEENAELLCKELKAASQYVPILVTTHDEALLSPYSDTILRIQNKTLVEETHNDIPEERYIKQLHDNHQNNRKKYLHSTLLYVKAHKGLSVITVFFLLCILLASYSIFYYSYTRGQAYQKEKWNYNDNLIELTSKYRLYDQKLHRTVNMDWDYFTGTEIKEAISHTENIVAVSYLRDYYYFSDYNEQNKMDFFGISDQTLYTQICPFFTIEEIDETLTKMENEKARVFAFEILDETAFPLSYGSYPRNKNEILINEDFANILLAYLDVASTEELIGTELHIDIDPFRSASDSILYGDTSVPKLPITIVGVTSLENEYENRVYFQKDTWMKQLAELYDHDVNELAYNAIRFLIDPSVDIQSSINDLQQQLTLNYSDFTQFSLNQSLLEKNGQVAQIHVDVVLLVGGFLILSAYFVIFYLTFFFRSQYKKEKTILENYGYSHRKIILLTQLILGMVTLGLGYLFLPFVIEGINILSMNAMQRPLFAFDEEILHLSMITVLVSYLVLMQLIYALIGRRKHI